MNSSRICPSSLSNSPAASWPKQSEIELGLLVWCRRSHLFSELGCRFQLSSPQLADFAAHVEPLILDPREPSRLRVSALALRMVQVDWLCKNLSHGRPRTTHQTRLPTAEPSLRRPPMQLAALCSCSFPSALKVQLRVLVRLSLRWTCLALC